MRLTDFQIFRQVIFPDHKQVNLLTMVVEEAFRFALTTRPIDAPFGKLLLEVFGDGEELPLSRAWVGLGVARVAVQTDIDALRNDGARRNEIVIDLVDQGLRLLEREVGWSHPELDVIIRELRDETDPGLIELDLERTDRKTGRRVRVFYRVSQKETAVEVVVSDRDSSEIRRERVASSDSVRPLEMFFPVHSVVLKNGVFTLRDRQREPLAVVLVTDDVEGASAGAVAQRSR